MNLLLLQKQGFLDAWKHRYLDISVLRHQGIWIPKHLEV